jgi:hypothetical protein
MFFYVIELETTIRYISIFISLPFFSSWHIIRHEPFRLMRKHSIHIHIRVTSASKLYLATSLFILKIWKRIWEWHYLICFHPNLQSGFSRPTILDNKITHIDLLNELNTWLPKTHTSNLIMFLFWVCDFNKILFLFPLFSHSFICDNKRKRKKLRSHQLIPDIQENAPDPTGSGICPHRFVVVRPKVAI